MDHTRKKNDAVVLLREFRNKAGLTEPPNADERYFAQQAEAVMKLMKEMDLAQGTPNLQTIRDRPPFPKRVRLSTDRTNLITGTPVSLLKNCGDILWADELLASILALRDQLEPLSTGTSEFAVHEELLAGKNKRTLSLMLATIKEWYKIQCQFAAAAAEGPGPQDEMTIRPQTFEEYLQKPAALVDGDSVQAASDILQIFRKKDQWKMRALAAETWVAELIRNKIKDRKAKGYKSKKDEIAASEAVLKSIGVIFPDRYEWALPLEHTDEVDFGAARPQYHASSANRTFRARQIHYYECMEWLRFKKAYFLIFCKVDALRTILGDFSDCETKLAPWVNAFEGYAFYLEKRAWQEAANDYNGRALLTRNPQIGQEQREQWSDDVCSWATIKDSTNYHNSYGAETIDTEMLLQPNSILRHGYLNHTDMNATWMVDMKETVGGQTRVYSPFGIPVGSFIGLLPGCTYYRPSSPIPGGCFRGPKPGLFINEEGVWGRLSFLTPVTNFEKGNVMMGWSKYRDPSADDCVSFHLVLLAYRPVLPFQTLYLYPHLLEMSSHGSESESKSSDAGSL